MTAVRHFHRRKMYFSSIETEHPIWSKLKNETTATNFSVSSAGNSQINSSNTAFQKSIDKNHS